MCYDTQQWNLARWWLLILSAKRREWKTGTREDYNKEEVLVHPLIAHLCVVSKGNAGLLCSWKRLVHQERVKSKEKEIIGEQALFLPYTAHTAQISAASDPVFWLTCATCIYHEIPYMQANPWEWECTPINECSTYEGNVFVSQVDMTHSRLAKELALVNSVLWLWVEICICVHVILLMKSLFVYQ